MVSIIAEMVPGHSTTEIVKALEVADQDSVKAVIGLRSKAGGDNKVRTASTDFLSSQKVDKIPLSALL